MGVDGARCLGESFGLIAVVGLLGRLGDPGYLGDLGLGIGGNCFGTGTSFACCGLDSVIRTCSEPFFDSSPCSRFDLLCVLVRGSVPSYQISCHLYYRP